MSNGKTSEENVIYEYVEEPAEEKKVEPKRMDAPAHPVRLVRRVVEPASVPVAVKKKDFEFVYWKELAIFAAGVIVGLMV